MNDELTAWFHCGHCASLFRAAGGDVEGRRCSVCGEDPSIGLETEAASASRKPAIGGRDPMLRVKMAEVDKPKVFKREIVRQKGRYFAIKLIGVWALLMVAVAVVGNRLWRDEPPASRAEVKAPPAKGTLADEDSALLVRVHRKCVLNLSGFLSAGTPEERNQFVRTPVDTARRMGRFYQANPFVTFDVPSISGAGSSVIHLEDGRRLVETRWAVKDGRSFDVVFFDENGEWRLDWEEFVRFSEHPWSLFLSESGDGEGEFRLFARERLLEQSDDSGPLRIALHAPMFGYPKEVGDASPEFEVDRNSEAGRLLGEALRVRKEGGRIYGSELPIQDPDGMVRVRVRVKRTEGDTARIFTIEEVKACHWLSIEDSGVSR